MILIKRKGFNFDSYTMQLSASNKLFGVKGSYGLDGRIETLNEIANDNKGKDMVGASNFRVSKDRTKMKHKVIFNEDETFFKGGETYGTIYLGQHKENICYLILYGLPQGNYTPQKMGIKNIPVELMQSCRLINLPRKYYMEVIEGCMEDNDKILQNMSMEMAVNNDSLDIDLNGQEDFVLGKTIEVKVAKIKNGKGHIDLSKLIVKRNLILENCEIDSAEFSKYTDSITFIKCKLNMQEMCYRDKYIGIHGTVIDQVEKIEAKDLTIFTSYIQNAKLWSKNTMTLQECKVNGIEIKACSGVNLFEVDGTIRNVESENIDKMNYQVDWRIKCEDLYIEECLVSIQDLKIECNKLHIGEFKNVLLNEKKKSKAWYHGKCNMIVNKKTGSYPKITIDYMEGISEIRGTFAKLDVKTNMFAYCQKDLNKKEEFNILTKEEVNEFRINKSKKEFEYVKVEVDGEEWINL